MLISQNSIVGLQASLDAKADAAAVTTLETEVAALPEQADLDLKAPIASPTFTGTVGGITKSMVGLGNVDNTTDANKPVSTATQTALDLKATKVGLKFYVRDGQGTPHFWQLTIVAGVGTWTDVGTSQPTDGIVIYA